MKLQRGAKGVPVRHDEPAVAWVAAAVLKRHRVRLRRCLPFARGIRGRILALNRVDETSVRIFVEVRAAEWELATEILAGFYRRALAQDGDATFIDEGSIPVVRVGLRITGSALDEAPPIGNARRNSGGLLGDNDRLAANGSEDKRASMDGQQCGTDASLRQAVASE